MIIALFSLLNCAVFDVLSQWQFFLKGEEKWGTESLPVSSWQLLAYIPDKNTLGSEGICFYEASLVCEKQPCPYWVVSSACVHDEEGVEFNLSRENHTFHLRRVFVSS